MSNTERQNEILSALRSSQTHPDGEANFCNKWITKEEMEIVCSYIKSNEAASLQSLNLSWNDEIGEQICIALTSSQYCKLQSLNLQGTGFGCIKSMRALGEYLISPSSSHLKTLSLSRNYLIGDNEVDILCSALSFNSTLSSLHLLFCNIGDRGASSLEYLLSHYNSSLSSVVLIGNNNVSKQLQQQVENLAKSENRITVKETPPPFVYHVSHSNSNCQDVNKFNN